MKNIFLYLIGVLFLGTLLTILGGFITTTAFIICCGFFACLLAPLLIND